MPTNLDKKDLRNIKTEKALKDAMFALLKHQKFEKLTVKDICENAFTSRAAFYTHFADKYDLLKYCLLSSIPNRINNLDNIYKQTEQSINGLIHKNKIVIKNIVNNANSETLDILFESILSTLNFVDEKSNDEKMDPQYIVLSNIYAGGLVSYLSWLVRNDFPSDIAPMNIYLYETIKKFII